MMPDGLPTISVLVLNRNRHDCLAKCLNSVAKQEVRPLEIVVLDAESTDGSLAYLETQKAPLEALGIQFIADTCIPAGVSVSRNRIAARASGDLLFFLDNDASLDSPDTLENLRDQFHQQENLGLVACRILARDSDDGDPFCWVYRRSEERWHTRTFNTFTFSGGGCCIRASAYQDCGGFWEVLEYSREEEALGLRLLDRGWRIAYRPEAVVRHYPDPKGRHQLIDRRAVELKNGVLIYWHAYPLGAGLLFSLLRVASMSLRAIVRREGSLRTLLAGWRSARNCWQKNDLQRQSISWKTMAHLIRLHIEKGADNAPST